MLGRRSRHHASIAEKASFRVVYGPPGDAEFRKGCAIATKFCVARGSIRDALGDFPGALEDYERSLPLPSPQTAYTGFWCALLRLRLLNSCKKKACF